MDSAVKKTLAHTVSCELDNEKDLRSNRPSSYIASISGVSEVYSLFPGQVLFLGYYRGKGTVYVAVSNHEIVRYMNLQKIEVWKGQSLQKGDLVGLVGNRSYLQFEYCTQWKGESVYPVRTDTKLYYKQNPIDILDGKYVPTKEIDIRDGITRPNDKTTFTEDEKLEWEAM